MKTHHTAIQAHSKLLCVTQIGRVWIGNGCGGGVCVGGWGVGLGFVNKISTRTIRNMLSAFCFLHVEHDVDCSDLSLNLVYGDAWKDIELKHVQA